MYKEHKLFSQPPSETKIWRYLKKQKIFSLFESKCLFFAKASSLEDPFEGRYPLNYQRDEGASFNRARFGHVRFNQGPNYVPSEVKESVCICCFTMNEYESDVSWKAYLQGIEGAAIQLTVAKLISSLDECQEEDIFIGEVTYLDYKSELFYNEGNLFTPFLHKRAEYTHENELRAITTKVLTNSERMDKGIFIPVSLQNLLERIVLSPNASKDFENQVTSFCIENGLGNIVVRSTLEDKPAW